MANILLTERISAMYLDSSIMLQATSTILLRATSQTVFPEVRTAHHEQDLTQTSSSCFGRPQDRFCRLYGIFRI